MSGKRRRGRGGRRTSSMGRGRRPARGGSGLLDALTEDEGLRVLRAQTSATEPDDRYSWLLAETLISLQLAITIEGGEAAAVAAALGVHPQGLEYAILSAQLDLADALALDPASEIGAFFEAASASTPAGSRGAVAVDLDPAAISPGLRRRVLRRQAMYLLQWRAMVAIGVDREYLAAMDAFGSAVRELMDREGLAEAEAESRLRQSPPARVAELDAALRGRVNLAARGGTALH